MKKFKSEVILGDKYRDSLTGFEGPATMVTFYLYACERATLEFIKDGEIKYESFDVQRLIHTETGAIPFTEKTGGPGGHEPKQNWTPHG